MFHFTNPFINFRLIHIQDFDKEIFQGFMPWRNIPGNNFTL